MNFEEVFQKFQTLHEKIFLNVNSFTFDSFEKDNWEYENGSGGGVTYAIQGDIIEKGGVNFSCIHGTVDKNLSQIIKISPDQKFSATGISVIFHPFNPYVPTIHMNVRFFMSKNVWWFGGGIDLTPYYPIDDDIVEFHSKLKNMCDKFSPEYYPLFKKKCDQYFYNKHRKETRGVGGIFFDFLSNDFEEDLSFVHSVGEVFLDVYLPILKKRKETPFRSYNRQFQSYRQGRYVEFNLLYDRGTRFGLESGGRVESILISLPLNACWKYNFQVATGSPEDKLKEYLQPRDWLGIESQH